MRRAAATQERIGQLLGARLAERGGDLQRVHRAREAARAYADGRRERERLGKLTPRAAGGPTG